jgi:mannose-1-phosphate guanylyltransferase
LSGQVNAFVEASPYREDISLVHERDLLGTAGTLIANLDFFAGADGMLIHADNYCLADFSAFLQAHRGRPPECVMTMMTFRTDEPSLCGIVEVDTRGVVVGFHEKVAKPPGNLANGAVYVLSADLLKQLSSDFSEATDFSTEILSKLIDKIYTYETSATFLDIGTVKNYAKANICV